MFRFNNRKIFANIKSAYEKEVNLNKQINEKNFNEKIVEINLRMERNKADVDMSGYFGDEYIEKVVLYGYMILFGNICSLAPLIVLIILLVNLRANARSLIWFYRRPVAYKAQSIGGWILIFRFLNVAGIINLSNCSTFCI